MLSYIASFLGFGERSFASPPASSLNISCSRYGWTGPDPTVRLRVSAIDPTVIKLWGFPPQEDFLDTMEYPEINGYSADALSLVLQADRPTCIRYVMGDDWRPRLDPDHHSSPNRHFCGGEVVHRPTVEDNASFHATPEDLVKAERVHSLRMRRCGAVPVSTELEASFYEELHQDRSTPKRLYGWSSNGAVWILRSSEVSLMRRTIATDSANSGHEQQVVEGSTDAYMQDTWQAMKGEKDMEGVCRVLEDAGAAFYSNIGDCAEAVQASMVGSV